MSEPQTIGKILVWYEGDTLCIKGVKHWEDCYELTPDQARELVKVIINGRQARELAEMILAADRASRLE